MIRGLYVDYWRGDLDNQTKVDRLLTFCDRVGVTDLMVQTDQVDKGTIDKKTAQMAAGWDYLAYICANKGGMRIHAWVNPLQIGREGNDVLGFDPSWKFIWCMREFLNPMLYDVKEYIVRRMRRICNTYPNIDGLHIDKMRYPIKFNVDVGTGTAAEKQQALNDTMQAIKQYCPNVYISATIIPRPTGDILPRLNVNHQDWQTWLDNDWVDEVIPIIINHPDRTMAELFMGKLGGYVFVFGCELARLSNIIEKIPMFRPFRGVLFFSYNVFSSDPAETRAEFREIIRGI